MIKINLEELRKFNRYFMSKEDNATKEEALKAVADVFNNILTKQKAEVNDYRLIVKEN